MLEEINWGRGKISAQVNLTLISLFLTFVYVVDTTLGYGFSVLIGPFSLSTSYLFLNSDTRKY